MVPNRKLLIALIVLVVLTAPRFFYARGRVYDDPYFTALPTHLKGWEAKQVYPCTKCYNEINEQIKESGRVTTYGCVKCGKRFVEKEVLDRLQQGNAACPLEGCDGRLIMQRLSYETDNLREGHCPFHPQEMLAPSYEMPVHPVVFNLLPKDTDYHNASYAGAGHPVTIDVSIVTSSSDRRSIHRPERCLPAQGGQYVRLPETVTIQTPDAKQKSFQAKRFVMEFTRMAPDGRVLHRRWDLVYYYFISLQGMTDSFARMVARIGWDQIVRGELHRWSYVLVQVTVPDPSRLDETRNLTEGFLREFFTATEREPAGAGAEKN